MTYFPTEPSEIEEIFYNIQGKAQTPQLLAQDMDILIDATKAQLASYGEIYAYIAENINSTSDAIHDADFASHHYPADYFVAILRKAYALKEGLWTTPAEVERETKALREKVLSAASVISFPLADMAQEYRKSQKKKASKPRTAKGMTPEQQEARNNEIIQHYNKAKSRLKLHGFATRYAEKYGLSVSQIKKILSMQIDT